MEIVVGILLIGLLREKGCKQHRTHKLEAGARGLCSAQQSLSLPNYQHCCCHSLKARGQQRCLFPFYRWSSSLPWIQSRQKNLYRIKRVQKSLVGQTPTTQKSDRGVQKHHMYQVRAEVSSTLPVPHSKHSTKVGSWEHEPSHLKNMTILRLRQNKKGVMFLQF